LIKISITVNRDYLTPLSLIGTHIVFSEVSILPDNEDTNW